MINALIGASAGLAVGGALLSTAGVVGSVIVGSPYLTISFLGATGAQAYAVGALAYDAFAMFVAPIFGLEMEPMEITP